MLNLTAVALDRTRVETLAVPVCEDAEIHLDDQVRQLIAKAKAMEEFSGEKGQRLVLYDPAQTLVHRAIFIGVGPRKKIDAETLRAFAGQAVKKAMALKAADLVLAVPLAETSPVPAQTCAKTLLEGARLANHSFQRYKEKSKNHLLKKISLLVPPALIKTFKPLLAPVDAVCQGALHAREWVSTPSNDKLPVQLAKEFVETFKGSGVTVRVLDESQLKRQKMNALLAVAAGSSHPPCLVEMIYAPANARQTVVLVGKGITFDTGGVNLKPSAGLETMKADMSGAAAVAGAVLAISKLKPRQRIIGITPIVENMISGSATRPGDVVTSLAGKTVEIGNTDAEGRLILIDAMAYAQKRFKPDVMIDLATLTGACVIALGEKMAGVFSPDNALRQTIVEAGQAVHERCWPMPMPDDYMELLKSDIADISNMSSSRYGGAIAAALFLSEFVNGTPWAHIDIAGPAFSKKGSDYCGPGGTGFGVRLLCEVIERLDQDK
ncbi:MAG: leucyl aminopeptidase [Desulfobacteraceae bacterium]|nr:leucyl aminopeptidase [Desulfobacteraceae bacterium]